MSPVMQTPFVCCLALCTLLFSQAPTAANTLTSSTDAFPLIALTARLNNSTLGFPTPPENFDLTYEIGGPKLRITPCLMNTVAALKQLALGDWEGKIVDGTEYRLDNYPEVSIVMTTPKRKRNVQARFVMWALSLGMYDMIEKKKFEFAQFEMLLNGQTLGWVQVVNHPPVTGFTAEKRQANGTLHVGSKSATLLSTNDTFALEPINITNVVTVDDADDPAEARLDVTFEPYGETLGVYDVFLPIMSGLTDMARSPSTHQSSGIIIGLQGYKGVICIFRASPPRTDPPFMEYGWVIRAISRIPTYMLEHARFGEVGFKIAVDGLEVASGRLSTAPDCSPDASPSAPLV